MSKTGGVYTDFLSPLGGVDPVQDVYVAAGLGVVNPVTAEDVLEAAMQYDRKRPASDTTLAIEEQPELKRMRTAAASSSTTTKKIHNEQWDAMFERLRAYKAKYGDCLVPKRFAEDAKLGTWVETQRVQYKRLTRTQDDAGNEIVHPNKRLTAERLQKLESVGFAWVAKFVKKNQKKADDGIVESSQLQQQQQQRRQRLNDAQWEEMYQRLVQYKESFGDCLVPRKFEGDPKLATWVETQRVLWNKEQKAAAAKPPPDAGTEGGPAAAAEDSKAKRLVPERKQKLDALGFVWSLRSKRIEDHWDEMFSQLLEYKKIYGDCLVPSRFESNLKLGKWVETQRYEYTKLQRANGNSDDGSTGTDEAVASSSKPRATNPRLTEDRLRRLEAIGFEWRVKNKMKRYYDKQWDQMFQRLMQFKEANGHCLVPKRYPPDMKLGTWVHTQRIQYRKLSTGKKGSVTEEEVAKLLAGQSPTLTEEEKATMKSCAGEEVTFRLTEARRKRLEGVGFVWSAREGEKGTDAARITRNTYDDQWDNMFEKLKEYKQKHGDCLVPKRYKDNPKLGTWVDTQRVQFKKLQKMLASQGKTGEVESGRVSPDGSTAVSAKPLVGRLTEDRIQRLQSLGFIWSLRDDWQKHYEELKAFKQEHGHCNVPARYEKNRRLGIWVSAQRQQYKIMRQMSDSTKARRSAPLTEQRISLLNEIGFTWTIRSRDTFGESWNQRFEELKGFKRINGHCLVPSRYAANPELGVWVGTQRTQYRLYMKAKETGTVSVTGMNEDRIRELEAIGFAWGLRDRTRHTDTTVDEVVAAAQAAAAVEAEDQVAGTLVQFNVEASDEVSVMDEYVTHQI